jgi:hypothetical protein
MAWPEGRWLGFDSAGIPFAATTEIRSLVPEPLHPFFDFFARQDSLLRQQFEYSFRQNHVVTRNFLESCRHLAGPIILLR